MLIECANCGFYLNSTERFCPDCGISEPSASLPPADVQIENRVLLKIVGIVGGAALIGFIFYRLNGDSVDFGDWFRLAFLVLFIGAVVAIIAVFSKARGAVAGRTRFAESENGASLQFIEDTCAMRNHELNKRQDEFLVTVRRGVRRDHGKMEVERRQPKNEISELLDGYDLFLNRIILARLQNQILPLASSPKDINDADFFDELEGIKSETETLSAGIERQFSGATLENLRIEKQNFLGAARKTAALCATLAARRKEAAQFGTAFAADYEASTNQTEILDARRTLGEISGSFSELEREYEKLKI